MVKSPSEFFCIIKTKEFNIYMKIPYAISNNSVLFYGKVDYFTLEIGTIG